jgi:hypothetical protein
MASRTYTAQCLSEFLFCDVAWRETAGRPIYR